MSKLALVVVLYSSLAFAENVTSGHYLRCKLLRGNGAPIAYTAWVTVHENVQPFEVMDVSLSTPPEFLNTLRQTVPLQPGKNDGVSITAIGPNKMLVISASSLRLTAQLKDAIANQEYSCSE